MPWGEQRESASERCEIQFCPRPAKKGQDVCEVHWREFLLWLDKKHGRQVVDL